MIPKAKDDHSQSDAAIFAAISSSLKSIVLNRDERQNLRAQVQELSKRVDAHEQLLKELFAVPEKAASGSFEDWYESPERTSRFLGKHVAFITGEGVIATADTLGEVIAAVQSSRDLKGVVFGFIPLGAVDAKE